MHTKSTIETSRKIYAMNAAFKLILQILAFYIFGKSMVAAYSFIASYYLKQCVIITPLSETLFITAVVAIGTVVSTLQIADGIKGHEVINGTKENAKD
jgi:hypothetical protein